MRMIISITFVLVRVACFIFYSNLRDCFIFVIMKGILSMCNEIPIAVWYNHNKWEWLLVSIRVCIGLLKVRISLICLYIRRQGVRLGIKKSRHQKMSFSVSKICFLLCIYAIIIYTYLPYILLSMKKLRTSIVSPTKNQQLSHDNIQKHILKKILEQGLDYSLIDGYESVPEVIYTLKKALLCDLSDQEIFTIAQTFNDVDVPVSIGDFQEPMQIQESLWQKYLSSDAHKKQRTSDHQELQAIAMDHIAQCLYGVSSYQELL